MAYSYVNYTGDGDLQNFSVPFPYLRKSHVKVYVQGILKSLTVHYTWLNLSTVQFNTAPLEGEVVTLMRSTSRGERLVDYQTGSILDDTTLDLDSNQLFYLMQEAFDSLAMAENADGAIFTSPASILNAITGQIDVEHLVNSLNSPIGYWNQIHKHDAIYEFNEDGTSVYDHGVLGDEEARISLAESRITVNEDDILLLVSDGEGHAAAISLNAENIDLNVGAIETVDGKVTTNAAAIVITAEDIALNVEAIETVDGRVTTNAAAIVITEEDIALNVIDISDVDGKVDTNISQLALMADEFYVKLDDNGNVTGFGLYNGETSAFIVNADTFAVINANGEGDAIVPFIVDGVSGLVAIAGNLLVGGSITGAKIAANTIEAGNIAATTITAGEIVLGTIVNNLLADGTIEGTKITEDAIDTPHLAANCVEAAQIKAGVVDTAHLAALSISTALLQVGSADETIIADGAISTQKLQADCITANEINANAVEASHINVTNLADIANLQIGTTGYIRSAGKTSYGDVTAGFWIGYESGYYKLAIGNASNFLKWSGTGLAYTGALSNIGGAIAGSYKEYNDTTTNQMTGASYTKCKSVLVGRGGTLRVAFRFKNDGSGYNCYARIYKNGAAYGSVQTNTTPGTYKNISTDLSYVAGDRVEIYAKGYLGGHTVYVDDFSIGISNPLTYTQIL
jgi:hypothetical protein